MSLREKIPGLYTKNIRIIEDTAFIEELIVYIYFDHSNLSVTLGFKSGEKKIIKFGTVNEFVEIYHKTKNLMPTT